MGLSIKNMNIQACSNIMTVNPCAGQRKIPAATRHFLLFIVFLLLVPAGNSQALTLKIATISPEGATWMVKMRKAASEISARTEKRVEFKFYPGGVMGNDASVLRKIRAGQLHGGAFSVGSLANVYPDSQLYALPFLFNSREEVNYVREKMDPVFIKGLEDHGFVSFGFAEGGFAYLMSKNPLKNVNDLKKQKVWIPAGDVISKTTFETANVSPIPLPIADVMTSLQTGLINTVATSPIAAIALQWHTRIKYLTDTPLIYFYALLAINKKIFARISLPDQKIVREIMAKTFREIDAINKKDNINAKQALINQGIKFIPLPGDTLAEWHATGEKVRNILKEKGLYTQDVYKNLADAIAEFRNAHRSSGIK